MRRETECSPSAFDDALLERIKGLAGGRSVLQMRWGDRICKMHDELLQSCGKLGRQGSAFSHALKSRVQWDGRLNKIYCHRTQADAIRALVGASTQLIHSLSGYRNCSKFDSLVVLGSLRKIGIGRVPPAVVMAPRFHRLVQVVWSTDKDDPDFGFSASFLGFDVNTTWNVAETIVRCGHLECDEIEIQNEVELDSEVIASWTSKRSTEKRRISNATLMVLGGGQGLALRNGGRAMVFNAEARDVIEKEAHEVEEGEILLMHEGQIDFGELSEIDDDLVRRWRNDLRWAHEQDAEAFLSSLRRNGIKLKGLASCITSWMGNHRPQQQATLEGVCAVLGWDQRKTRRLWKIFAEHHGKAIQTGTIESELERETVESWIRGSEIVETLAELPMEGVGHRSFNIHIGDDLLVLNAYVVDGIDLHESIDEGKIGKLMSLAELQR